MRMFLNTRIMALAACATLIAPAMVGCGGPSKADTSGANLPPLDASQGGRAQTMPAPMGTRSAPPQKSGMSTGTKVMVLAGAAALYYLYKKNKEKRAQGDTSQPQYYLSKNGRVYYRTANGQAVWVTPPAGGVQVPYTEAQQYSNFQGYNNQSTGQTLLDLYNQGTR
ncbi:hypothetical protein BH11ARM2_BH11ARM2_24630 [soil metagenome]